MSAAIPPVQLAGLLQLLRTPAAGPPGGGGLDGAPALAAGAFEQLLLEALLTPAPPAEAEAAAAPVAEEAAPVASPSPAAGPPAESSLIAREAERTGVDPALLTALRRTENGGAGREFGVISVAAPTLETQARIAANTVKNNLARYQRQGGTALDPVTGRYTEGFLRYLSARYAPVGAANDPAGLNRHHASNLISLYRKASGGGSGA